jgi:hypothetical protein
MARPRAAPPAAPPSGPYLQAAFLCERVLTERDGVNSYIRVVDRVISAPPVSADDAADMPPVVVNLVLAIALKSGEARGSHNVRIALEEPSGLTIGEQIWPVLLEGDADRGINLHVNFAFQAETPGIYWFVIRFGDDKVVLTRVPVRVVYAPQQLGVGSQAEPEG